MIKTVRGKMSTFGGPKDKGVKADENLALVNTQVDFEKLKAYFLEAQPPGTTGYARRLNTATFYMACRWSYRQTPRSYLQNIKVKVTNPRNGKSLQAQPIDWGPNKDTTGRNIDLSNGLATALGLETDDECIVEIPLPSHN